MCLGSLCEAESIFCRGWVVVGRRLIRKSIGWHRGARRYAQLVYKDTERDFTERSKPLLMNALIPGKWWPVGRTAVCGASSRLPPFLNRGGKLILSADKKASLLSKPFDDKQC